MITATLKWKGGRWGHRSIGNKMTLENLKYCYEREEGISKVLPSSTHNIFQDASKVALKFSNFFN